jgi:hypothetical protein
VDSKVKCEIDHGVVQHTADAAESFDSAPMRSITSSKKSFSGFSWYICNNFNQKSATITVQNHLSDPHSFCEYLDNICSFGCAYKCKWKLDLTVTLRQRCINDVHACLLLAKLKLFFVALRSTGTKTTFTLEKR